MVGKKQPIHKSVIEVCRMLQVVCHGDQRAIAGACAVITHLLNTSIIPADHEELASAIADGWPNNDLKAVVLAAVEAEKARVEEEKARGSAQMDLGPSRGPDGLTEAERLAKLRRELSKM